jgi:hypothetical protein
MRRTYVIVALFMNVLIAHAQSGGRGGHLTAQSTVLEFVHLTGEIFNQCGADDRFLSSA